jgi:hypothetical protein
MSDTENNNSPIEVPDSHGNVYVIAGETYYDGLMLLDQLEIIYDYHYDRVGDKNILYYTGDLVVDGTKVLEKIK